MTVLGKLLVMLNVGFSLVLAGWSFALYSNRIDWTNKPAKAEQSAGEYAVREAQIKELWQGVYAAESQWRGARSYLEKQEGQRVAERRWYRTQLEHVRSTADASNPVMGVVFAPRDGEVTYPDGTKQAYSRGQVMPDAANAGRPLMAPAKDRSGNPLVSLAAYNREAEKVQGELVAVLEAHRKQIDEATKLTERLIGPKGLQQRLLDEKAKQAGVVAELDSVRPLLINTVVESSLLLKRQKQMQGRIAELEKADVATRE